ncbi:hypothetical protein SDC9_199794 [bioreactor metagenome]|uniref:Uncharacterized protein n=1 Tax=bioreactor metagenome TaxID=1076179 RepID=A0A645IM19_9ZZZZ
MLLDCLFNQQLHVGLRCLFQLLVTYGHNRNDTDEFSDNHTSLFSYAETQARTICCCRTASHAVFCKLDPVSGFDDSHLVRAHLDYLLCQTFQGTDIKVVIHQVIVSRLRDHHKIRIIIGRCNIQRYAQA